MGRGEEEHVGGGSKEMGTPMTSQELKEILERLARVFQAKLQEISSSRTVVTATEPSLVMQRIELLSNDIKFEGRRAAMCHLPSLPSMDEAVASMEQEEIRQKVMIGETSPAVR